MPQPPRRPQKLAIALPATFTQDIPHLREKTSRIGLVARTLAIFRVEEAIIYQDQNTSQARTEARLIEKILQYQQTPQYLRKQLFKIDPDLAYTGTLPPLRTPNHPDPTPPSPGQLRDAIVTTTGQTSTVNAGYKQPVTIQARLPPSKLVTIRLTRLKPSLQGEPIDPTGLTIYWGPRVTRDENPLGHIIKRGDHDLTISTSRQGRDLHEAMPILQTRWKASRRPLIAFGSPREGIPDILQRSHSHISEFDLNLNTLPHQGVETVRTEEALLGTLAVLNLLEET
jgi:predicted SPOUT superfamily RNA methylase MTH1